MEFMRGPRNLTPEELRAFGLGLVERQPAPGETVRRSYCLRCGGQVASDRRDVDPEGWWVCARGCNTRYASDAPYPTDFAAPPTRPVRRRFDSR